MDEALARLTRGWLTKAMHDLQTARITANGDGPLDMAIHRCQQTAEKSVKGWLTANEIPFEKTHDIGRLIRYAEGRYPDLACLTTEAETLTPYASAYRYPGLADELEPSLEEFDVALRYAECIFELVVNSLPAEVRP